MIFLWKFDGLYLFSISSFHIPLVVWWYFRFKNSWLSVLIFHNIQFQVLFVLRTWLNLNKILDCILRIFDKNIVFFQYGKLESISKSTTIWTTSATYVKNKLTSMINIPKKTYFSSFNSSFPPNQKTLPIPFFPIYMFPSFDFTCVILFFFPPKKDESPNNNLPTTLEAPILRLSPRHNFHSNIK